MMGRKKRILEIPWSPEMKESQEGLLQVLSLYLYACVCAQTSFQSLSEIAAWILVKLFCSSGGYVALQDLREKPGT